MIFKGLEIEPSLIPILDKEFVAASLFNRAFRDAVLKSGKSAQLRIAIERGDGLVSTYETPVFDESSPMNEASLFYAERLIKTLLWIKGGWKITIGGPKSICEYIKSIYTVGGLREFDARFMGRVYEKEFTVEIVDIDKVPGSNEKSKPLGRHLKGCRIGFDAGGSDRKVAAVIDGNPVYSEEVIWHPKTESNPDYHYSEILKAMKTAASHMPRVDAIGVSSAGIYINNRVMVASLFVKVSDDDFDKKVKDIYLNIQKEMGNVPLEVANDGDVTALAGAMELNDNNVLGIAMGTSEAGGYVDSNGNITGWLNELAFVPVDYNQNSAVDEWSGDYGCGVKYFSQDAVIKLSPVAGINLDESLTPAEKLKTVQEFLKNGDERAKRIFESIGCYLGYAIAHYADFYDIKHVLILGRVTSGDGGNIILETAKKVLSVDFPELAEKINLHLPDESSRRVGQAVAAASLPEIK
ncbi:MAG TPA: ROK family protein [Clostridiaceae bacterium]|nr:ROK family protein [Clostridiaceae bacterium]